MLPDWAEPPMLQDEGRERKLSKQQLAKRLRTGTVSRQ